MTDEEAYALVRKLAEQLGEHFPAVQILVSRVDRTGTLMIASGSGDWYARKGLAMEYLTRAAAETFAREIRREEPGDGEKWKEE